MKDAQSAIDRLCNSDAKVSAHYVVDEDGDVIQLVEEADRAWHAGHSYWRGTRDINSASIGIELINPGHEFGYRPFADAQIRALQTLLPEIMLRHHLDTTKCLLGHSDIAPTRKKDPGELFPWKDFALNGFGVWPNVDEAADKAEDPSELLTSIGYDISDPQAALLAFQRRFHPEDLSGVASNETLARLMSVRDLLTD
jgi:N-acetylmuramoyl-L-alanine amidase